MTSSSCTAPLQLLLPRWQCQAAMNLIEFDFRFAIFAKSQKRVQHLSCVLACHFTYCAKLSPTYGSILTWTTPTSMSFTHLRCKASQQKLDSTWVVKEVADALGGGLNSVPCCRSACTAYTALPIVSYLHFSVCWWSPRKDSQRQAYIQTSQCHVCHPLVRVTYWTQDSSEAHINLWYQHAWV